MSAAPPTAPFFLAAALLALALAYSAADLPAVLLLVPAGVAVLLVGYAAFQWPERTISAATLLVLMADTKFRWRDPSASLRSEIDAQVLLELALYGAAALIVVVVSIRKSARPFPTTLMEALLFGFGTMAVVSTLWSSAPPFTLVRGTQLLIVYTLGRTLLLSVGPVSAIRVVGGSVLLYVLVCSAIAIAFPWTLLYQGDADGITRFTWFGVWPTQAARFVALAALLLVAGFLFRRGDTGRRRFGLPDWVWVAPLCVLLALTYSRTALAAFLLGVGALVAIRYLRIRWATAFVAGAAALALIFVNSGETMLELLERGTQSDNPLADIAFRGQTTEQLATLSNRVSLWQGVWQLFLERPLLGYGYQGSRAYLLAIAPWAGHAHNALAQAVLDLGIGGAVAVCWALASCLSPRFLRAAGPISPLVGWRVTVLALGLYLLVVSVSAESFVEPGYEALVFVICVLARERIRFDAASRVHRDIRFPRPRSVAAFAGSRLVSTGVPDRSPTPTPGGPPRQ